MTNNHLNAPGSWIPGQEAASFSAEGLSAAVCRFREAVHVVQSDQDGRVGVAFGGQWAQPRATGAIPLMATLPALYPEWLGDRSFSEAHGTRFPYVAGAMANGIATTDLVIAMAQAGMLGFFGAAGLSLERVEQAITQLQATLDPQRLPWGSNLIHSPQEPDLEEAVADLYIRRNVRRVSASAYMALTPAVVRYSASGLRRLPDGQISREHHLFAKISRPEVARRFMEPAPQEILDRLVQAGKLSQEEANLAREVPVAEDYIVESNSGGHTDLRPLGSLFPMIRSVRDQAMSNHGYRRPIRLGAAGGLGEPSAVAAAFSLGAAFVLTGSVNQSAVESGLAPEGRAMLAQAGLADVMMAPAADMFAMGVKVQVLKRGTMFAPRAARLYEIFTSHGSMDALPAETRAQLEQDYFRRPLEQVWADTRAYWADRDPAEVKRADEDPKHRMALCFRWYLGMSSRWAIQGQEDRRPDYQIWCGPAMGAFNDWAQGTFLEAPENRQAVQIALNLLEGAAAITRAHQLRSYGVAMPAAAFEFPPRPLALG